MYGLFIEKELIDVARPGRERLDARPSSGLDEPLPPARFRCHRPRDRMAVAQRSIASSCHVGIDSSPSPHMGSGDVLRPMARQPFGAGKAQWARANFSLLPSQPGHFSRNTCSARWLSRTSRQRGGLPRPAPVAPRGAAQIIQREPSSCSDRAGLPGAG